MLEAENLKEKFRSCADLPKEAAARCDATVKAIDKAKLASFPKDVQPLIEKVSGGPNDPASSDRQCRGILRCLPKSVPLKQTAHAEQKPDPRQAEYERFSRSYLQELKQKAAIDYRGS